MVVKKWGEAILERQLREDISEEVIFKQRTEGTETEPRRCLGKRFPDSGNSKCKGPEVGMFGVFKEQ